MLVENVDSARKAALQLPGYTAAVDLQVVRSLEAAQRAAGVKDLIHDLVEERTDDTVPMRNEDFGTQNGPPQVPEDLAPQPGEPPYRPLIAVLAFAISGEPI